MSAFHILHQPMSAGSYPGIETVGGFIEGRGARYTGFGKADIECDLLDLLSQFFPVHGKKLLYLPELIERNPVERNYKMPILHQHDSDDDAVKIAHDKEKTKRYTLYIGAL